MCVCVGGIRVMAKSMEVKRLEKEVLIHVESIILLSPRGQMLR